MTQLSDKDHKAQMAAMKAFDEQMPCIGIFWYDPEVHTLCDVNNDKIEFSIVNWPRLLRRHALNICPRLSDIIHYSRTMHE